MRNLGQCCVPSFLSARVSNDMGDIGMRQSGSVRFARAYPGLYEQPEDLFGLGQETDPPKSNMTTLAAMGLIAAVPIGFYVASKTAKLVFGLIPVFVAGVSLGYLMGARK